MAFGCGCVAGGLKESPLLFSQEHFSFCKDSVFTFIVVSCRALRLIKKVNVERLLGVWGFYS